MKLQELADNVVKANQGDLVADAKLKALKTEELLLLLLEYEIAKRGA